MTKRTKKILEDQEEIASFSPEAESPVEELPLAEETALVADYVLDASNTKAFLGQLHRKVAVYQSVLFTGEGLTDAALLVIACARAWDAVKPGGVLYIPKSMATVYPVSRLEAVPVEEHPGYLRVFKEI